MSNTLQMIKKYRDGLESGNNTQKNKTEKQSAMQAIQNHRLRIDEYKRQKEMLSDPSKTIMNTDVNNDSRVGLKDLVRAKKMTASSSGAAKSVNEAFTGEIEKYLTSNKFGYNSVIIPSIEKLKNNKLTSKGKSDLIKTLDIARKDVKLSEKERVYYGELYNELSEFKNSMDFDYNFEAEQKGIDIIKGRLEGIKGTENRLTKLKNELSTLELAAAKGNAEARTKLENNKAEIKSLEKKLEEAYKLYGSKGEISTYLHQKEVENFDAKVTQEMLNAMNNSDFDEYSRIGSMNTELTIKDLFLSAITEYVPADESGKQEYYEKVTTVSADEEAVYNYYLGKYGPKKAKEFFDSIKSRLKNRYKNQILEQVVDFTERHPIAASAASVLLNVGSGVEYIEDSIKYMATGELDDNSASRASSTIRGTVSEMVDWEIGNWDAFDFVYNTTMSGIDSLAAAPFGNYGAVTLGLSAAANTTNDILDRGGTNSQAFVGGIVSGIFEGFFEKYSISQLNAMKEGTVKGFKDYAKNLYKSMIVNASEETATEAANILYDYIANGGISQYSILVQDYIDKGFDEETAKKKASSNLVMQIVESGASGALMGFGFSSLGSAMAYRNYKKDSPFAKQVDEVLSGKHNPRFDLYVSETPEIFTDLGFSNSPLLMRNGKVKEILNKHSEMSVDTIKKIPEAIKKPILILKSKTHPTQSVVAITDIETVKGNMIIPVWINQSGNYIDIDLGFEKNENTNFIASAYGRDVKALLKYASENEGFLYQSEDTEKVRQLLARNGLQLPTPLKLSDSDINISQDNTNVNNNISNQSLNNYKKSGLQSNANGDIINDGGDSDVNGEATDTSIEEGKNFGGKRKVSQSNATIDRYVAGGKAEILSRTPEDGRRRIKVNYKKSNVTFAEGKPENTSGYRAYIAFCNAGINAIYCDGEIIRNVDGKDIVRKDAFTAPDGTVYVSSFCEFTDKEIYDHERVHVADFSDNPIYIEYYDTLNFVVNLFSDKYIELADNINREQFTKEIIKDPKTGKIIEKIGKYDINNPDTVPIFIREIAAYVNQYVLSDLEKAERIFGEMFKDWGAVVDAVNKFNTDMGADFSESASFMPGNEENGQSGTHAPTGNVVPIEGYGERHRLSKAEQDYITEICKALGRKVVFEHISEAAKKLGIDTSKGIPDGYYENGVIHLGFVTVDPIQFVFKHELTHFTESVQAKKNIKAYTNTQYDKFVELAKKSDAFREFLEKEFRDNKSLQKKIPDFKNASIDKLFAELCQIEMDKRSWDSEFTPYDAQCEVIANFVGKILFTEDGSGLEGLLSGLDYKERNVVAQFIRDFFKWLIEKLGGNTNLSFEIRRLEYNFNRALSEATATKKIPTESGGNKYTIASDSAFKKYCQSINEIANNDSISQKGQYIEVSRQTPSILIERASAKNLPLAMQFDTAYLETRHSGKLQGNYHNLGAENMQKLPQLLENPEYIVKLPNGRLNVIVDMPSVKGSQTLVSIELEQSKQVDGKFNKYNLIITAFGAKDGYISKIINSTDNEIVYNKKTELQGTDQLHKGLDGINNSVSNNSIIENGDTVNNNSMSEIEKDTSDIKFSFARVYDTAQIKAAEKNEQEMKDDNKSEDEIRRAIWQEHKIIRDTGGIWVYEIDDRKMSAIWDTCREIFNDKDFKEFIKLHKAKRLSNEKYARYIELYAKLDKKLRVPKKLTDYVKHDVLFEKYPQLKNVDVVFKRLNDADGSYNPNNNVITLNIDYVFEGLYGLEGIDLKIQEMLNQTKLENILLHEIQHALQYYDERENGSDIKVWSNRLLRGERLPINPQTGEEFTPFDAYMHTHGEYEAYETVKRQEKNKELGDNEPNEEMPDLGWGKTISVKEAYASSEVKFSIPQGGIDSSIKQQLNGHSKELNSLGVVFNQTFTAEFDSKQAAVEWVVSKLKSNESNVERKGFGEIVFDKKRIKSGIRYAKTKEEIYAFTAVPQVLRRGIEIATHSNHKGRIYDTVTFAAPIVINGKRGNMAVVVRLEDKNYYKVHRVLMPDGSQFLLDEKGDTVERAGGVEINSSLSPTNSVSNDSIPKNIDNVNKYYTAVVENGDTEKAQELVDKAAKSAGYSERLYHQTGADFTEFNTENQKAGKFDSELPTGTFLKPTDTDIGLKGKKQMELYAKFQNPLHFDDRKEAKAYWSENIPEYKQAVKELNKLNAEYRQRVDEAEADVQDYINEWRRNNPDASRREVYNDPQFQKLYDVQQDITEEWDKAEGEASIKAKSYIDNFIKDSGYDGIIIERDDDGKNHYTKSYIAFSSAQMKYAGPVTYDDNGNVIPLSERFNSENKDIRFSIPSRRQNEIHEVDSLTEEQYNNFGWVRYNNVLDSKEYSTLISRYADYKHDSDSYPTTRFGEAVIHSTECPDVIMYVKGSITNPEITKIVRIEHNECWAIPYIIEEVIKNERKRYLQPFKTVEDYFGYGVFSIIKARDYAPFRQNKFRTEERENSKAGDSFGRALKNRDGGLQQNSTNDRTSLTEEQYNNFGWVRYNNVLDSKEYSTLISRYADYKHNSDSYPTTRFGEAVIHSTECPEVIMYVKGSITNPTITKIVHIIADDSLDVFAIKERILHNEYKQKPLPYQNVTQIYGEEYIRLDRRRDFKPFRQNKLRTEEGGNSQEGDSFGRALKKRDGGFL